MDQIVMSRQRIIDDMFIRTHFKAIKNSASKNFPKWLQKKNNLLAAALMEEEQDPDKLDAADRYTEPTLIEEVKKRA